MTYNRLFDSFGRIVALTREIGRGGEGYVTETADNDVVAKIYHSAADTEKSAKLREMARLSTRELLAIAAWPIGTLHGSPGGPLVGFLQPKVVGHREIHQLYSPVQRRQHFPGSNWAFLLHVAMNCASAVQTIHDAGHVIGDINQSGILVSSNGTVRLIDCDSFQVKNGHQMFRCHVGVPFFTPPELQGQSFRDIDRAPHHDCFGLAVIVFHLLFMGRHPFSGRFTGGGEMPIERAISEGRFAFSRNAIRFNMMAPPHALPIDTLPSNLESLFERAFALNTIRSTRPSAEEWRLALADLKNKLAKCRIDPSHHYPSVLSDCPWCRMEQAGGPAFFSSISTTLSFDGTFNLSVVWARISAVRRPPGVSSFILPPIPRNIVPAPLPQDCIWEALPLPSKKPIEPTGGPELLPDIPIFEPETVPEDYVYKPTPIPVLAPYIPANFAAAVDARYKRSSKKWIRYLFPGPADYNVDRKLAEEEDREHFAAWKAQHARTERERNEILSVNSERERWCRTENERLHQLRTGLAERNKLRHEEWQIEVQRTHRLRAGIEAKNRASHDGWIRDRAEYLQRKAVYDQQIATLERAKMRRSEERQRRQRRFDELRSQTEGLRHQWMNEARSLITEFAEVYRRFSVAKDGYEILRREFERRKSDLQEHSRELQLRDYLMNTLIDDADIPGIGRKRKATLAGYGIEAAYDITGDAIADVPGFGTHGIGVLLGWRDDVERLFRFDSTKGISPSQLRSLHMTFHARKVPIQRELSSGEERLQDIAGRGERRLKDMRDQAAKLVISLAQAKADVSIA